MFDGVGIGWKTKLLRLCGVCIQKVWNSCWNLRRKLMVFLLPSCVALTSLVHCLQICILKNSFSLRWLEGFVEETEALQRHLGVAWEEVIWERKFNSSSTTRCPPIGTLILHRGTCCNLLYSIYKGEQNKKSNVEKDLRQGLLVTAVSRFSPAGQGKCIRPWAEGVSFKWS